MRRLARPILLGAICAVALPVLDAHGVPSGDDLLACKPQVVARTDHWTRIHAPKVDEGEGPRTIVDFATPPNGLRRIYATNGKVVKLSADAGCTWKRIALSTTHDLNVDQAPRRDVITHLAAPSDTAVWAASYDEVDGVAHPHVYAAERLSDDNLGSPAFVEITAGVPVAGRPVALVASTIQPGLVYLTVEGPGPDPASSDLTPARHLYVAHIVGYPGPVTPPSNVPPPGFAIGPAFTEVPLPAGFSHLAGIAPSTYDHGLWIWQGTTYASTSDALANSVTWTTRDAHAPVAAIDVDTYGTALVAVKSGQAAVGKRFGSNGKRLPDLPLKVLPRAIAHGARPGVYALAGPTRTFGYDSRNWSDITPRGVAPFTKVRMPNGRAGRIVLALSGDSLYRFDTYLGERFVEPDPLPEGVGDWTDLLPPLGAVTSPVLRPTRQVVEVAPGQVRDVPVDLTVPGTPTRLNVYFLLDTTGSMQNAINGLRTSITNIARRLRRTIPGDRSPCFGLGDFKDWVLRDTQRVYTRDVPMSCDAGVVTRIATKLRNMQAGGGGDSLPEAQTIALQQAAKGDGQPATSPIPVPAGQDAQFEADAYKVVVLISDSAFNQGPGYPTIQQAVDSLNSGYIDVVSVLEHTGQSDKDLAAARLDMEAVARGTDTSAPSSGIDCDSDGVVDLAPHDPLVCDEDGSGSNIGRAIIGLLEGVPDPGVLAIDVHDPHHVVHQPIKGKTRTVANLKRQASMGIGLPVTCTAAQEGQDLPIGLVGTARALPVAVGEVVVRCRAIPPPVVPRPRLHDLPTADLPRPPRPPVALALPNPPPGPAQPISNINLNAGFSQQEEQQYQLATVAQGAQEGEDDGEVELAASDHRGRDSAAGRQLLGGAVIVTAAAFGYRRRLQYSNRPQSVRI